MQKIDFKTQKTASVYTIGRLSEHTQEIWYCLHGYGQRADYFANNFKSISTERRFIVLPEGLNRFYLEGFSGKVGATWMTSYERQTEINDYVEYLENLHAYLAPSSKCKIVVFSFSQGAATASRWLDRTDIKINEWIIWAGTIAIDIDYTLKKEKYTSIHKTVCLGTKDPFFDGKKEQYLRFLNENLDEYDFLSFEGEHKIKEEPLKQIAEAVSKRQHE